MIVKIKCHLWNYCSLNKFLLNVYAYQCCKLDIHVTDLYSCIKISIIIKLLLQFLYKSLTRYSVSTQQNVSLTANTLQILLSRQRDVRWIAGHSLLIIGLTHVEPWQIGVTWPVSIIRYWGVKWKTWKKGKHSWWRDKIKQ